MTLTLRPATASDIAAITAIYAESVANGIGTYELDAPDQAEMARRHAAITADRFPYLVAVDSSGVILGYAYASPFRTRPAYDWICENSVYVAADARGRSVGRLLLERLIEETTALGLRQMVAVIGGANPASVALHRALGFIHVGTMPASGLKFGRWLDTVIMQRALGEGSQSVPGHRPDAGANRGKPA